MNQISLAEIVLGKDLASKLRRFFQGSWWGFSGRQRDYRYRTYITRRAFNLNEFFFSAECAYLRESGMYERASQLEELRRHTFITQHALCGYVDELLDAFEETGEFPAVLIIDELAVCGHEITMVMQQFESLIKSAWRARNGRLTESVVNRLDAAILKAVDLCVYAKSKEPLLLKNHYKNQLTAKVEMDSQEWKEYVQSVSRLLQTSSEIDNTNYCPTYLLSAGAYESLVAEREGAWEPSKWTYRTVDEQIWQKRTQLYTDDTRPYETVRCYYVDDGKQVRLVPQVLFGAMSAADADELCWRIRDVVLTHGLDDAALGHIGALLQCRYKEFRGIRMQLVSYILCAAALYDFTREAYTGDLALGRQEKPMQSFGTIEDVAPILDKILDTDLRQELSETIRSFIAQHASALYDNVLQRPSNDDDPPKRDASILRAEKVLYSIANEDEMQAFHIRAVKSIYDSQTRFANVVSLQDYLGRVACKEPLERSVATLLLMLDANIVSLNTSCNDEEVFFNLKVGELSKTLRVRWMYRFMPALLEIEQYCRLYGYDTVKIAELFGEYLDEKEQYCGYKELFYDFTDEIYSRKQRLQDWDINLLSDLDMPKEDQEVRTVQEWSGRSWSAEEWERLKSCDYRLKYILWELQQQADYLRDAADFLRTKLI